MNAITAKASRIMKKYAVLTREPRCFLGSFDFSWEQRKLGELVDRVVRKNTNNESTLPLTISAQYGLVDQITYFNNRVASRDVSNYYLVLNGEFAYNKSTSDGYPFGAVKRLDLYEKGVLSTLYIVFAPKKEQQIDSDYLTVFFDTDRWHKGVAERAAEGARNHGLLNISAEDFFDIDLSVPKDIVEQKQIGAFIRQLDNLITLHQRKCANLCSPSQVVFSLLFATSTFSWEQRKFEEIAVRSSVICSDDTLPRVEYEDIVSGTGRLNKDIYAKQSIKSGIAFHQGDVLYGKLRPYLQNWLLPTFDGLAVGDFWVLQPQNADSSFLYRLIQSRQFDEVANQSTGTKMPRADWKLVSKTVFSIPSNISEQAAIGTYFTALDSLITLHQRKFEKLTNVKKSMLEKMFPQNGSSYPEIRFKGFTDPWEQRKLGDIGKARSGVGFPDADQGGVTGVPFFKVSDMNLDGNENEMIVANNYVTAEQIADHRWSPITELPAIFFAKVGAAVMLNRKRLCRFPFLLDNNTMAYSLSPTKWDADFAKALFGTVDLTSLVQVGALPSYNAGDVESMGIYLPSLFEQEQIGAFFKLLDNLITLHQRELEKLQNIKKSMLEKMFV